MEQYTNYLINACRECGVDPERGSTDHYGFCSQYKPFDENGVCKICKGQSPYGCPNCEPDTEFVRATHYQGQLSEWKGPEVEVGAENEHILQEPTDRKNIIEHLKSEHGIDTPESGNKDPWDIHENEHYNGANHSHGVVGFDEGIGAKIEDILGHQPHPNTFENFNEMSPREQIEHIKERHKEDYNYDDDVVDDDEIKPELHTKYHSLLNENIDDREYDDYAQNPDNDFFYDPSPDHEHWPPTSRQNDVMDDTNRLLNELNERKINRNRIERRAALIDDVLNTIIGK